MHLPPNSSIKSFAWMLYKNYPKQIVIISFILVLAAVLELLSLATLLPILFSLIDQQNLSQPETLTSLTSAIDLPSLSVHSALAIMSVFMVFRGALLFLSHYMVGGVAVNLEKELRHQLFTSKIHSSWAFQSGANTGNYINAITQQVTLCAMGVMQFGHFFTATITAFVLLIGSFVLSWKAFIIFMVSCLPYLITSRMLNVSTHNASKLYNSTLGQCSNEAIETNNLTKFYKASGHEHVAIDRFDRRAENLQIAHHKLVFNKALLIAYPEAFGVLTLSFLLAIVHSYGLIETQELILFLILMYRAYMQISRQQSSKNTLIRQVPSFQIVSQCISDAVKNQERSLEGGGAIGAHDPLLKLHNVGVSYNGGDRVLKGINLDIKENQILAIVGRSGSGKTSLVDCILGLVKPSEGDVLIHGKANVNAVNIHEYRSHFAYVPQESYLFSGTVKDNIIVGNPGLSDKALEQVINTAQLNDVIDNLPDGIDTYIDGNGNSLSGGQKQRIALARALAIKPAILILDEATSALDNHTDDAFQKALLQIKHSCSIILIAHKLSSIKIADNVCVLDKGKIVEMGQFDQLMNSGGALKKLKDLD